MTTRELTSKQQNVIDQVAATMAIEDMPLTEKCYQNLKDTVTGKKTEEQVIREIIADAERKCTNV